MIARECIKWLSITKTTEMQLALCPITKRNGWRINAGSMWFLQEVCLSKLSQGSDPVFNDMISRNTNPFSLCNISHSLSHPVWFGLGLAERHSVLLQQLVLLLVRNPHLTRVYQFDKFWNWNPCGSEWSRYSEIMNKSNYNNTELSVHSEHQWTVNIHNLTSWCMLKFYCRNIRFKFLIG